MKTKSHSGEIFLFMSLYYINQYCYYMNVPFTPYYADDKLTELITNLYRAYKSKDLNKFTDELSLYSDYLRQISYEEGRSDGIMSCDNDCLGYF